MRTPKRKCHMKEQCAERRRAYIEGYTWDRKLDADVVERLNRKDFISIFDFYDEPIYDVMCNCDLDEDELTELVIAIYREENKEWSGAFFNPYDVTYQIELEANAMVVAYDACVDYKSFREITFGELLGAPFLRVQHIPPIVGTVIEANENPEFDPSLLDTGDNDMC